MTQVHFNPEPNHVLSVQATGKRYRNAGEEFIEAAIAHGEALLAARQAQPGNSEFGAWLAANDLDDLPRNERAALMRIAEHPDLFREMAGKNRSVEYIWDEKMRFAITDSVIAEVASPAVPFKDSVIEKTVDFPTRNRDEVVFRDSLKTEVAPRGVPIRDRTTEKTSDFQEPDRDDLTQQSTAPRVEKISAYEAARSRLKDLPKYEVVVPYVRNADTRSMLAGLVKKRNGRAIWDLLVRAVETGAYGPPFVASVSKPNLRLILPWAPKSYAQKFDLMNRDQLTRVRDLILPVVTANLELVLREPDQLLRLINEDANTKRQAALEARGLDPVSKHKAAVAAMPVTEQEVVMYGQVLWPAQLKPIWNYQELVEACWFYRVIQPMFKLVSIHEKKTHEAQGTMQAINLLLKWMPTRGTPWSEAVRRINNLYAANPDGECRVPPPPPNFGLY